MEKKRLLNKFASIALTASVLAGASLPTLAPIQPVQDPTSSSGTPTSETSTGELNPTSKTIPVIAIMSEYYEITIPAGLHPSGALELTQDYNAHIVSPEKNSGTFYGFFPIVITGSTSNGISTLIKCPDLEQKVISGDNTNPVNNLADLESTDEKAVVEFAQLTNEQATTASHIWANDPVDSTVYELDMSDAVFMADESSSETIQHTLFVSQDPHHILSEHGIYQYTDGETFNTSGVAQHAYLVTTDLKEGGIYANNLSIHFSAGPIDWN